MLFGSFLGAWVERRLRYGSCSGSARRAGRRGAADAPRREGELAKKCHPDVLRARGAGEREIAEATERMTRLNAAWDLISSQNS